MKIKIAYRKKRDVPHNQNFVVIETDWLGNITQFQILEQRKENGEIKITPKEVEVIFGSSNNWGVKIKRMVWTINYRIQKILGGRAGDITVRSRR